MRQIKKQGFTIIEIMIVVGIIGLLAVMGIPYILNAYSSSMSKAKDRNIAEVEKAKGVLSLPVNSRIPGAMALADPNLEIAEDDAGLSNLCSALSIRNLDELTVGSDPIAVGTLWTKASYGSPE